MAPHGSNKNESALASALAKLFDAVRPATRSEAEDELRTAGVDPDAVGQRIKQLSDAMLSGRQDGDMAGAAPPRRAVFTHARLAWSVAAALVLCLVGWALVRDPGGTGLLEQYRERLQRAERTQRNQQLAGGLPPAAPAASSANRGETTDDPPPTAAPPAQPTAEAAAPSTDEWSGNVDSVDTDIPLPSRGSIAGVLIPAGVVPAGEVVTAKNLEAYGTSFPPGLQWAVGNGLQIRTIDPRAVYLPQAYRQATEQYAGQARIGADGVSLENYVAGLPFPAIDPSDRQAAIKIMWNYEYRPFATDDLEARDFELETGTLGANGARMAIERRIVFERFRRLYYSGRLFVDPRPELPNSEGIRFRESLHPLREPLDLRGAGQTSIRYTAIQKPDDTWLYLPGVRRVRKLSLEQRADPLWGQDADPDSFFGFSGPLAGMNWRLLGMGEVVGCLHAENRPVEWGAGSADFVFDDVWEMRPVYVIEGTSTRPYGYDRRVLYLDQEAWVVLFSDIYDRKGELWKIWLNMFSTRTDTPSAAVRADGAGELIDNPAAVMIDVRRHRATRIAVPSRRNAASTAWAFNQGERGGITEDWFKIAHLIESGR